MKKRSNVTTIVVVIVLLCGLGLVAAKVTPPPPGPEPTPQEQANSQAEAGHHDDEEQPLTKKRPPAPPKASDTKVKQTPPLKNPDSIDIGTEYWKENKDGKDGTAKLDKETAAQRAALKAQMEKEEQERKSQQGSTEHKGFDGQKTPEKK